MVTKDIALQTEPQVIYEWSDGSKVSIVPPVAATVRSGENYPGDVVIHTLTAYAGGLTFTAEFLV